MPNIEVNFANLNVSPQALFNVNGGQFRDFLQESGYDGAEITLFRGPLLRRMLGAYATEITRGLHAPFAGRTFPEALKDMITQPHALKKNLDGLGYTAVMPEVSRATSRMADFQSQIEKGNTRSTSQLDAVLYPFSGDNPTPLAFDDTSAPFRTRTFQLTAEVLHRWGLPVAAGAPGDELLGQLQNAMKLHGFDALTLDTLDARRTYVTEMGEEYVLPEDFVETVALEGLFANVHMSVGRTDVTKNDATLHKKTIEEAKVLRGCDIDAFLGSEQAELVRLALAHYNGKNPFRITLEEPNSVEIKKGNIANIGQHADKVALIKSLATAA